MWIALLLALLAACAPGPHPGVQLPPCDWARTVRVIDGDTIVVRIDGVEEHVRYIGVDAPEVRGSEPYADEASHANAALVAGEQVCLERDVSDRDRFGRLLRYAWLEDGRLVEQELVAAGMAVVATFPPDVSRVDADLLPAQRGAQQARLGLWQDIAGDAPPCYREGQDGCNCHDFAAQPEAQVFHERFDPDDHNQLDANRDGVVCESLP